MGAELVEVDDVEGLLLDAVDDADGVEDDPQAASAKAARPATATAPLRDTSVEVDIPSPSWIALYAT